MTDPEVMLALKDCARLAMGVYPASVVDGSETLYRTEWQNGWNAYGLKLLECESKIRQWYESLGDTKPKVRELLVSGEAFVQVKDGDPKLFFLTSDLFAWGYANWDEITEELLDPLHAAWKANGVDGMLIWWCKHQNQKPQRPIEKSWRESGLWDSELESLPDNKCDSASNPTSS